MIYTILKATHLHFAFMECSDSNLEGRRAKINESNVSRWLVGIR